MGSHLIPQGDYKISSARTAKQLYLIGNGFDAHHNINSGYNSFREWLKQRNWMLYNRLFQVYELCGSDLWSSFEVGLGKITPEAIIGNNSFAPFVLEDTQEDVFLNSEDKSDVMPEIGYTLEQMFFDLQDAFQYWIKDLNEPDDSQRLKIDFENAQFISFNYTQTLEFLYNISDEKILYIHGKAATSEDLIFGHNMKREDLLNAWGTSSSEEEMEMFNEAADDLSILFKDTDQTISNLYSYWTSIQDVNKIHIWGLGLSDVDWPYIEHISNIVKKNNAEWEISWFSPEDYDKANNLIKTLHLKNAKLCRLDDYVCVKNK